MGFGEDTHCQKEKCSAEKRGVLGHNADATKPERKKQNATAYVNFCNYSTLYIV